MSTAYFSTIFKREVGESYTSYLTGIRMEKAAELIRPKANGLFPLPP